MFDGVFVEGVFGDVFVVVGFAAGVECIPMLDDRDGRRHAPEAQFVLGRMVAGDISTLGALSESEGGR